MYVLLANILQHFNFEPLPGLKPLGLHKPVPGIMFYPEKFDAIVKAN